MRGISLRAWPQEREDLSLLTILLCGCAACFFHFSMISKSSPRLGYSNQQFVEGLGKKGSACLASVSAYPKLATSRIRVCKVHERAIFRHDRIRRIVAAVDRLDQRQKHVDRGNHLNRRLGKTNARKWQGMPPLTTV